MAGQELELEGGNAPVVTIDDLRIPPMTQERKQHHLDPLSYQAEAVQGDVKAQIILRHYGEPRYSGGYLLYPFFLRTHEDAPGRMGYKQEARARALLALLEKRVEAALQAAGWVKRWKTPLDADLWLYVGSTLQSAPAPATGECDLSDIALAGYGAEVAGEDQAREGELADQAQDILPDLALEDQVVPEQRQHHIVEVVGSEEAKVRGQQPAYRRLVFTRPVTFTCIVCGETVTQERYPGHKPLYCSEGCREDRQRERTRERVARHRQEKKKKAALETQQSASER